MIMSNQKLWSIQQLALAILLASVFVSQLIQASHHHHYDPEQQDGIPVFSARSISRPMGSSNGGDDDWSLGESNRQPDVQRRQSDADLDDGMEEDDDDEYKSGSNPQESVENPSYGESGRSARDGDEIEDFFDKHLGPPQEDMTPGAVSSADESSPRGNYRQLPAVDPDDGDHYEVAATSPLKAIFESLLSHDHKHKRPFLQIGATSISSADSNQQQDAKDKDKDQQQAAVQAQVQTMKTSPSAQSFVETAPIALAFTPFASGVASSHAGGSQPDGETAAPPVREIYIGRRPTVMNYLQQAHAPGAGYATAGSSNVWRANGGRQVIYDQEQGGGDYARYPPIAASYAYQREQQAPSSSSSSSATAPADDEQQTVTYGLSFGGGGGGGGAQVAEDSPAQEQTVEEHESGQVDAEQSPPPQQQHQGYVPYNTRYSTSSTRAHNNYYDNNNNQPAQYYRTRRPTTTYGAYQQRPSQQQQLLYAPQQVYQQQYRPTGSSTRYHRDPSESGAHGGGQQYVAQYYRVTNEPQQQVAADNNEQQQQQSPARERHSDEDYASSSEHNSQARAHQQERQRLLASLNREIKASPIYQQQATGVAEAGSSPQAQLRYAAVRPRHQLVAIRTVKKSFKGDDLDSYNSFHSEVDPYKSFTSTSTMINNDPTTTSNNNNNTPNQPLDEQRLSNGNYVANSRAHSYQQNQTGGDGSQRQVVANLPSATLPHKSQQQQQQQLATGPLVNYDTSNQNPNELLRIPQVVVGSHIAANSGQQDQGHGVGGVANLRVRREDADEREIDNDNDDDGVWVDDDEDDDNRQQSSDVNETSQEPGGEESEDGGGGGEGSREDVATNNVPVGSVAPLMNPPGVIGGPHGYELSPHDLMVYHG